MYLAAEQLINHLTTPLDRGGLGVDPGTIVLVGQSIGSAVASEMCLRYFSPSPHSRAPLSSRGGGQVDGMALWHCGIVWVAGRERVDYTSSDSMVRHPSKPSMYSTGGKAGVLSSSRRSYQCGRLLRRSFHS